MKKFNLGVITLIVVIAWTLIFNSCITVSRPTDIMFVPVQNLQFIGLVVDGENVGRIQTIAGKYILSNVKYVLVSGEGDKDNNSFEIKNNNTLIAKGIIFPGLYSIRVKQIRQDASNDTAGMQNYLTFIIAGNPWDTQLIGTWSRSTDQIAFNTTTNLIFNDNGILIINNTSDWMSGTSQQFIWVSIGDIISIYSDTGFLGISTYTAKYNIENNSLTIYDSSNGTVLFPAVYIKRE